MNRRMQADLFLHPGEFTVQSQPLCIKTILGSCVAVCLWDPQTQIGGLNHFLLARPGRGDLCDNRFGSIATPALITGMQRAGAALARLTAFVIGGGHPLHVLSALPIGAENAAIALEILEAHGIAVQHQDTGGAFGRKLLFNTDSGMLIVRRLGRDTAAAPQESPA
jgi:chemotaxis protein CheD